MRSTASIGSATKNTNASVLLIVNATDDANISITGLLPNGLIPVDTEFCIFVTSLVRRVTSEETLKWSILANEYDCNFSYSACLILAPSPCPASAENLALPMPRISARTAQPAICKPLV